MVGNYISRRAKLILIFDDLSTFDVDEISLLKFLSNVSYSDENYFKLIYNEHEVIWWYGYDCLYFNDYCLLQLNPISIEQFQLILIKVFQKLNVNFIISQRVRTFYY